MHNIGEWPNLRYLCESLGGAEGLLEAVSFKKAMKVCVEEESCMLQGSELQTVRLQR